MLGHEAISAETLSETPANAADPGRTVATYTQPMPGLRIGRRYGSFAGKGGGAQVVGVAQAVESDLAQTIAVNPIRRALGLVGETDLAQPITRRKIRQVGLSTETNLAQAVGRVAIGGTFTTANETDLFNGGRVLTLTLTGRTWLAAGAAFDGIRSAIVTGIVGNLSGITDWDTAKSSIPVSNVVRTSDRVVTITLPALNYDIPSPETITATVVSAHTVQDSGDVTTAVPIVINTVLAVPLGQPTETDVSHALTHRKTRLLGQVTEAELAQAVTRAAGGLSATIGQVVETDAAQTITVNPKRRLIAAASETALAQALTHAKRKTLAQALETDAAQPNTAKKTKALLQTAETDAAQVLQRRKQKTLGQSLETDTAQAVSVPGSLVVSVSQAFETDLSRPIAWAPKKRLVSQVTASDAAQPLTHRKLRTLSIPLEADLAHALARLKTKTCSLAIELDLAQGLSRSKVKTTGRAVELDQALVMIYTEFLVSYIRIVGVVGQLPTCRSVVGRLATLQMNDVMLPTATQVRGVL